MNGVIIPLTALLEVKSGKLLEYGEYDAVANGVVREGVDVANALGVPLDFDDCIKRVRLVAEQTAGGDDDER